MSTKLEEMLSYCRPAGGRMEQQFITRFIDMYNPAVDDAGNRIVYIGGGSSRVMWSCHTDTVHNLDLRQKVRQQRNGLIYAASTHSNCLGADDTAGVWVALSLIERNVPGMYIFHYGEEVGCIGAKHIEQNRPEILTDIDISIALDRRGTDSLVTAQSCMEGCSDEFGEAFRDAMGMNHYLDPTGIWTDNVEYLSLIPEVVNLSVGYEYAHTSNEQLDPNYLHRLVDSLSKIDYDTLPVVRTPGVRMSRQGWGNQISWGNTSLMGNPASESYWGEISVVKQLLQEYPRQVAKMLHEYGFDGNDIIEYLISKGGIKESQLMDKVVTDDELWDEYNYVHEYSG